MKVLVIGGCTTRAQVSYLQLAFPGWDVRGAVLDQATEWVAQKHEKFLGFVAELDLFFGFVDHRPALRDLVPARAQKLCVPSFDWSGYHPDTVWLHGITSPMEIGVIHSRLAVSAWLSGLSQAEARALFTDGHFAATGLYDVFADDRARMEDRFHKVGIDIAPLFDRWLDWGNFLHTPNHPRVEVFFDIADAAMRSHGHLPLIDAAAMAAGRAVFPDYLAQGIVWPVYPAVAAHHGIAAMPDQWRTSADRPNCTHFGLDAMIARTFAQLADQTANRDKIITMMGGAEKVALYAGR